MMGMERIDRKSRISPGTAGAGGVSVTSGKKTGALFCTALPATPSPGRIRKSNRLHSSILKQEETHGVSSSPRRYFWYMQTQSTPLSRMRRSQMNFSRFSTWMFEFEISTTRDRRANLFSTGISMAWSDLEAPFPKRLRIEVGILAGGGTPGKVLLHPPEDDRLPPLPVRVCRKGPRDRLLQFLPVVPVEGEPRPPPGIVVGVDHRVGQPPRVPHDGDGPVLHAVELVQPARLVPGGHQEDVGPRLDLVRQPVVEGQAHRDAGRVATPQALHRQLVVPLARP